MSITCSICYETADVITPCGHPLCETCLVSLQYTPAAKCPMCRTLLEDFIIRSRHEMSPVETGFCMRCYKATRTLMECNHACCRKCLKFLECDQCPLCSTDISKYRKYKNNLRH